MSALKLIRRDDLPTGPLEVLQDQETGEVLMTDEQLGIHLGYKDPAAGIRKLYERNFEELHPSTLRVKLTRDGVSKEVRCWRREGVHAAGFLARTDRARAFRKYAARLFRDLETGAKVVVSREVLETRAEGARLVSSDHLLEAVRVTTQQVSLLLDRTERLEGELRDVRGARRRPGEVTAFVVARRYHWFSESGKPHSRAVLDVAKLNGFEDRGLLRQVLTSDGDRTVATFVFSPEGVAEFAKINASRGCEHSFKVPGTAVTWSVTRSPARKGAA
ncbi:MAG TPA: hypothetical protein DEA08_16020 [Planctomycetes bacterium]|nr:hypothetical protein [Planctomycetota bacterium]